MQLADRIEKRRFVGREFLLFLWFESETFDATLRTREHGPFGLWLEKRLVLSEGKESTRITAPLPGAGREAKEALLRGQLPESAGIRLARNSEETSFLLKADSLGVAGLRLRTALDPDEEAINPLLEELMGKPQRKGRGKPKGDARDAEDGQYEAFYERMTMTTDFEAMVECLYRDYLRLRLSPSWREVVTPLLVEWVHGRTFALDAYEALRHPAVAPERALELAVAPAFGEDDADADADVEDDAVAAHAPEAREQVAEPSATPAE